MNSTIRNTRFAVILAAMAVTLPVWSIPEAHVTKIEQAIPKSATAKPEKPRRVLVFSQTLKYKHSSIPYAEKAFELMAKTTDAYTVDVSSDPAVFEPATLNQYDAVVLNNNTGEWLTTATLRQSLLDFVRGGKGLVGIHAATDGNFEWAEFGEMLGGYFDNHPWRNTDTVTLKIDQPEHPLNRAFADKPLEITDEIYQIRDPYSRDLVLKLVSLDTDKTDMKKEGINRTDGDFPISWVKPYGKGRVFYCSLGHNEDVYSNPTVLQHYLDGLQYALGDLKAADDPKGNAPAPVASVAAAASPDSAARPTTGTAATKPVPADELDKAFAQFDTYDFGEDRSFLLTIDAAMRSTADKPGQRRRLINRLQEKALDENLAFAARDVALRRLGEIGRDGTANRLQGLLNDKDEQLAQSALRAITDIPGEESDRALIKALESKNGAIRIGIINALGQRRSGSAVEALTRVARQGSSEEVIAAVTALGKIGTRPAGQALLQKVRPPDAAREAWLAAMTTAADELAGKHSKLAARLYDRVLQMGTNSPARLAAFRGKAMLEENPEAAALKALDDGSTGGIAEVARQILVRGNNEAVAGQLLDRLKSASPDNKVIIIEILGARGEKGALDEVTSLASHGTPDNPALQLAALTALQHLGDQRSIPVLLQVAASQRGAVADTAVQSIVQMRVLEVDAELLRLINEATSPAEQVVAIEAAIARKSQGALEPVLKAAGSPNDNVAVAAFKALSVLDAEASLQTMLDLHNASSKDKVRREAGRTITSVVRASKKKADGVKQVQASLAAASDTDTKASLLSVLGRVGGTMALKTLQENLASSDEGLKDATVRALAEFPEPVALDDLMKIASGEASNVHKVLALRGIARLVSVDAANPAIRLEMARQALELAPGAEEKRALIGGVAELKTTGVLELILPYMDNADLKEETAAAVITHAPAANQIDPGKTAELLNPLRDKLTNDQWNKLEEALTPAEQPAGALRAFQISEVFGEGSDMNPAALLEKDFSAISSGQGWTGIFWAGVDDKGDKIAKGNIHSLHPGTKNAVVYLRTFIWSPEDRAAELRTGSDDGMRVWVNGDHVLLTEPTRSFDWDADKTKIQLKRGWNTLLLKVAQGSKDWTVAARLLNDQGKPMNDLKYSALEQQQ